MLILILLFSYTLILPLPDMQHSKCIVPDVDNNHSLHNII